jgi:hypothetical protein
MENFVPVKAIPYLEARGWLVAMPARYPAGTFKAMGGGIFGGIASHSHWSIILMQTPYEDIPLEMAKDPRKWTQDVLSWRLEHEYKTL